MKYFAYGSNIDPDRLRKRQINFFSRELAFLPGYEIRFNKKAKDGNFAYANIGIAKTETVEGALYEIADPDILILDKFEGTPDHYVRTKIEVIDSSNVNVEAYTYIANTTKIVDGLLPTKNYLDYLLNGKDLFSENYYKKLSSQKTV